MFSEPQEEHRWLQQLIGDWSFEADCSMGPGQPRQTFTGSQRIRGLGELWIVGEGEGEMPGGGIGYHLLTLGYDPARQRFVGSWVGSMMTHLWRYEGVREGRVLPLESEGPSFAGDGGMARYRDVVELLGPDHWTMTSQTPGEDGAWIEFMTAHYRRR